MIPVVLIGAGGRMGKAVAGLLAGADNLRLKARIDRPEIPAPGDGVGPDSMARKLFLQFLNF